MAAFHDECAVFGIWNDSEAGQMTYLGLYAQQHRGQESSGIVTLDGSNHKSHKGLGLVGDVFTESVLQTLTGRAAVGHNRYSTTGENLLHNAQPLSARLFSGPLAVAHNGNIVNAKNLREELISQGSIFQGSNDTEVLLHLLSRNKSRDIITCLKEAADQMEGAYSFAILTHDRLIAMRDPYGFRPLVLGHRQNENGQISTVIASETCAFDLIGAKYNREIAPGEIFWVDSQGEHSDRLNKKIDKTAHCVFEHVYFSRPDSIVFGKGVYEARKAMGVELAKESPVDGADLVIPVPDSAGGSWF